MGDDITIGVTEIVNNIEVTAQPNDQQIDISVIDNADEVTLNVTPTVVEVNINRGSSYARWGTIYGTLGDQTDLANALLLKADLVGGLVPAYQLPSFVDDVIEVANYAALPTVGETGKIYLTLDNNKIYRWSGSVYVEIASNQAIWGSITGTLSAQTDLQTALDTKALKTTTISTNSPLSGGGDLSANRTLSISQSNTSTDGYLSSTDWNTFNNKVPTARTLTINGTSYDLSADRSWTIAGAAWGSITGTLSSQTDLQSALNLKANDNAVVHLAGAETITGSKTFNVSGANNINVTNSSTYYGINISNSSTGKGIYLNNTGGGEGFLLNNTGSRGFTLSNNSSGVGFALFCDNVGSGMFVTLGTNSTKGVEFQGNSGFTGSSIFINNISGSTGNIIRGQRIGSDVFVVDYLGTTTAPIFQLQANNTVGSTPNYIGQTMATNDIWKIYGNTVALDQGELVFEIGDNGTSIASGGQRFRFSYDASGGTGSAKNPFILDYNDATFNTNATFSGNVGIGTTSPAAKLHVEGNSQLGSDSTDGDLTVYSNVSPFTFKGRGAYNRRFLGLTWDVSPDCGIFLANALKFNTNAATGLGTTAMTILANGRVGIGTSAPDRTLDVRGLIQSKVSGGTAGFLLDSDIDNSQFYFAKNGTLKWACGTNAGAGGANDYAFYTYGGSMTSLILYSNGNYQFFGSNVSDKRAKEKIEDLDFNATEKIMALQPKSYYMKNDNKKLKYGLIAQDVYEVLPDLVSGDLEAEGFVGLDYNGIIPILVQSIQELKAEIELLKQK